MKQELGKLNKVSLRKAWSHEANDFSRWLSETENIALLGEEIGIDISVTETEASVGRYNVDIMAEEENSGRKIIIENQLESTNHDHLGKVVTYASGFDAEIIIWIVSEVRDEHKRAVDWLNEHTDEDINFFAIKMELWQIDESPYAPKFQIISKPNDWAKALKRSSSRGSLTETKVMQLDFWKQFIEYAENNKTTLRLRQPRPQHWYDISIGNSESNITLIVDTQKNKIRCELYIRNNIELFRELAINKTKIEKDLGFRLDWMELEGRRASRIKVEKEADLEDTGKWDKNFAWLQQKAEDFHNVFPKYIRK